MTVSIAASGDAARAIEQVVPRLVTDLVASGITAQDPDLWGPSAETEAASRLGWVEAVAVSRPLVARIVELREQLLADGIDHVVLAGMGGSSLAPEVITRTAGVPLTVLDSTDPAQVTAALTDRLERTVLVVSSKSGSTLETDSQRRAYEQAFRDAGIDPAQRIVVVTDPGSPLEACRDRRRLPRLHRRPHGRRAVLRTDRLRAGARRTGGRGHRRTARRGGRHLGVARGRHRREPRARARSGPRRDGAAAGQDRHRPGRHPHHRVRRLGRAADRRVHGQVRDGPAPRRARRGRPRAHRGPARPAGHPAGRLPRRRTPRRRGRGRDHRHARRPVPGVGVRRGRRRATARHRPLRPARRRGGQGRHPRAARRRRHAASRRPRRPSRTAA